MSAMIRSLLRIKFITTGKGTSSVHRIVNGYPSIGKTVRSVGKDHLFQGRGGGHLMKHSKEMNINAGGVSQKKNWRHTTECPFQKGETVFQKTSLLSAINAI